MAEGRPGFCRDPSIDTSGNEKIVKFGALRRNLKLEPRRRLPLTDLFAPIGYPSNRLEIYAIFVFQDAARAKRRRREPRLYTDSLTVEIGGSTNRRAFVDVDIRMAKHALDDARNRRQSQSSLFQIGHVDTGEKFRDVELSLARVALPATIVRVDVNFQVDVTRLDPSIDERLASVIERASHAKF